MLCPSQLLHIHLINPNKEQKKWEENFNKQLKEIERLRQELINLKEEQLDYAATSAVEMEKMLLKAIPYFYQAEIGKDITYPFYKEKVKPFIDKTSYVLYRIHRLYGLSQYAKSLIDDVKNGRYLNREKALKIYTKAIFKFPESTYKISYKDQETLTAGILYFISDTDFSSKYSPWNVNRRRFLKLIKKSGIDIKE